MLTMSETKVPKICARADARKFVEQFGVVKYSTNIFANKPDTFELTFAVVSDQQQQIKITVTGATIGHALDNAVNAVLFNMTYAEDISTWYVAKDYINEYHKNVD